jgi:UDP-glucuronate 4-epimerase
MLRAVITGGAGFIGSHVAERLVADGWRVTAIDAFTPYYDPAEKEANLAALADEPAFDLERADIATMPLDDVLAERPAVLHLAAQPGVRGSFGEGFATYLHDNVLATQRLFDAARDAGCRRVVYASSSSVYGDAADYPCVEHVTATNPRSPYGVTKRTCELLGSVYRDLGLETVGLRYFSVYGPRQRPDMALRRLCEAALGGPPFRLYGDGTQSRDFTHVADAVEATVRALTAPAPGTLLNIGGGHEATVGGTIRMLERLTGSRCPVVPSPAEPGDVRRTAASTSLARLRLGWRPEVSLADGLRTQLDWVRNRRSTSALAPAKAKAG